MRCKKFHNFLNHKIGNNKKAKPILGDKRLFTLSVLFIFVITLFCFLFSIKLILGTVQLGGGNYTGDIDTVYAPSQAIKGWINISLVNEPSNSLLTAFNSNITLINFLKNNAVGNNYNCTPTDCSDSYDLSNPETSKTFSIKRGESKIIGLKLTGKLSDTPITSFSFNFNSNAPKSCFEQLRIDITDDNITDYIPVTGSGNYECSGYTGCFNESANLEQRRLLTTADYCEKIWVPKAPSYEIGAYINVENVENIKTSDITMKLLNSDLQQLGKCDNTSHITGSSDVSCIVNVSRLDESLVYVCIRPKSDNNYEIDAENQQPTCGSFDIENNNNLSWDYHLFIQGGEYAPVGSFVFDDTAFRNFDKNDNEKLVNYINEYLSNKYNNNCQNGCVIPIRFTAGQDQQIILSNLLIEYKTDSGGLGENKFYDTIKNSTKLNSGFLKLDLGKANLSVSSDIKNDTAIIKIGDTQILSRNIQIMGVPVIKNVNPSNPPAAVPVTFSVTIDRAEANMSYYWDFGDNSSIETTNVNIIKHTYPSIGQYSLTIKAIGKSGEYSKIFQISAVSPKSLINGTISLYENDTRNTQYQIDQLPDWMKTQVEKKINLTDVLDSIKVQKNKYNDGIDDNEAVKIMKSLLNLNVPANIFVSTEIKSSDFLMQKDPIDIDFLSEQGAGKVNSTKDDYYLRMVSWLSENLNSSVESKIYSVNYRNKNDEVLFSYVNFNLNPTTTVKELYFVINGDPDKIKINGDFKRKDKINSILITLNDLSGSKTIEFLYPETIDILNLPVYISPQFKYLPVLFSSKKCNLNGNCESKLGENYKNCSDCKEPWIWNALFWIIILLFTAFIVYIILQEWYKRHYESSLFKDKNQLFNLINYINNCELHNITRVDVYNQLKGMQWNDEQIDYAWNKLHGLRTGMWEIPIFKVFENNKVKDELRKRQMIGEKPAQGSVGGGSMNKPIIPNRIQPRLPLRAPPKGIQRSPIRDPSRQNPNRGLTKR